MSDETTPSVDSSNDAEGFIARAVQSVLHQIPAAGDPTKVESSTKMQPWADTAAPQGSDKLPLETFLEDYAQRVQAHPNAVAHLPKDKHPAATFFDRFTKQAPGQPGQGRRRNRRRWSGGARRSPGTTPTAPANTNRGQSGPPRRRPPQR